MQYDDLTTAAEQAAFEFGSLCRQQLPKEQLDGIGRLYAHSNQFVLLPRSDYAFRRLNAAFRAGAGIPVNAGTWK